MRDIEQQSHFSRGENFPLWTHIQMLSDWHRVEAIKRAIDHHADPEATFLEIGCGSGVFSIHAASRFAHVLAVEQDPRLLQVARDNAIANGVEDLITFLRLDAKSLTAGMLPHPPAIVLCELLSTWLATEPQVAVFNRCDSAFGGARKIPYAVSHFAEIVEFPFSFDGITVRAPSPEFAPIRPARPLSAVVEVDTTSFDCIVSHDFSGSVHLPIETDGVATAVRLSNVALLAPGIVLAGTPSVMPPMIVPLDRAQDLRAGERVQMCFETRFGNHLETARFRIERQ